MPARPSSLSFAVAFSALTIAPCLAPALAQSSQPAAAAKLAEVVGEISFQDAPAEAVFEWLSNFTSLRVGVRWADLGVAKDSPISLKLRNVTARAVLRIALDQLCAPPTRADYEIRGSEVLITTAAKLAGPSTARDYDLGPLIARFAQRGQKVSADEIGAAIQGGACRGAWSGNDPAGAMAVTPDKLRITQTQRGHTEIQALLAQLDQPAPADPEEANRDAAAAARLNVVLPEVSFQDAPLDQVIDWVVEFGALNVYVDWRDLKRSGIERDTALSIHPKNEPAARFLDAMLRDVGGKKAELAYDIIDGVVRIATARTIARGYAVHVYALDTGQRKSGAAISDLRLAIRELVPLSKTGPDDLMGGVWCIGDRAVVSHAYRVHAAIQQLLSEQAASHPAAGIGATSRPGK